MHEYFRAGWKKRNIIRTKVSLRRPNTGRNISVFFDDTKVMQMSTFSGLKKKRNGEKNFQKARLDSFQNILFTSTKWKKERITLKFLTMKKHTTSWLIMRKLWICG